MCECVSESGSGVLSECVSESGSGVLTLVQPADSGVHVGQLSPRGGAVGQEVGHRDVVGVVVHGLPVWHQPEAGLPVPQPLAEVAVLAAGLTAVGVAERQVQEERSAGTDRGVRTPQPQH